MMKMNKAYQWHCKQFAELSLLELYDILKIRQSVFVVEQNCAYLDVDELDKVSWHFFATRKSGQDTKQIVAYLRIVLPTYKYEEPSLGRILTIPSERRLKIGTMLIKKALVFLQSEYPQQAIRISAQLYLQHFYEQFGFKAVAAPYDEDGIAHIEMLMSAL